MEKLPIDQTAPVSVGPANPGARRKVDKEKLKKACADFEALITARMLHSMRQTVTKTGTLGNDPGREIYQGLMDQELSRKISQRGGLRLGDMLYRQVMKEEERRRTEEGGQPARLPDKNQSED